MKHLYFIRHGLSEMNVKGEYSGTSDTALTESGKKQASKTGQYIRDQGISFNLVMASPLQRAHDTAKLVLEHIGYPLHKIVLHEDLKERHFGAIEGMHNSKVNVSREEYENNPFALDHIEGIEKITDLQYRANQFLEHLKSLPHETILVVSHGAFGRALWRAINNEPLSEFGQSFTNAELVKLI